MKFDNFIITPTSIFCKKKAGIFFNLWLLLSLHKLKFRKIAFFHPLPAEISVNIVKYRAIS